MLALWPQGPLDERVLVPKGGPGEGGEGRKMKAKEDGEGEGEGKGKGKESTNFFSSGGARVGFYVNNK